MLSDEKRTALIQMCHEAGVMLQRDSKFGHPDYTSVQSSWPALEILAIAVAEAAVKDAGGGDEPFGWYFMDDPKVFTLPGTGFRVGAEPPTHSIDRIPLYTRPQASAAVPEGMVLVPVEPTYEMKKQGIDVEIDHDGVILCMSFEDVSRIYRAMLAASQPEVRNAE